MFGIAQLGLPLHYQTQAAATWANRLLPSARCRSDRSEANSMDFIVAARVIVPALVAFLVTTLFGKQETQNGP